MPSANRTLMQYFHWDYPDDGSLWRQVAESASALAAAGISVLWLPPPTKAFERGNPGYAIYDLWDLGEFDQKGSVRTKYGTRAELEAAVASAHASGLEVYLDIVFNHKAGADATDLVGGTPVDRNNRNLDIGPLREIAAWTHFRFDGRGDRYSGMKWNCRHFDSVDYDNQTKSREIYRICDKHFETVISPDMGNFDFLMFADVDSSNEEVRKEFRAWGEWMIRTVGFDGFRIDAAKHINPALFADWLPWMDTSFPERKLFAVGEYFDGRLEELHRYIDALGSRMALFDFPLYFLFREASQSGGAFDMRRLVNGTLVATRPADAVTFVENHDTAREPSVQEWFKPLAYAVILLRQEGYPCIFYLDYYGGAGRQGHRQLLDRLLAARRDHAFGPQHDYFDHEHVVGWTRLGDGTHPSAIAVLMSDSTGGEKRMFVDRRNARFSDITANVSATILTDASGHGVFRCNGGSVSVWVEESLERGLVATSTAASATTTTEQTGPANASASTTEARQSITVHFKRPADWGPNVRVHYWGTQPVPLNTTWPGETMEPRGGNWFSYELVGAASARIVFTDGQGRQSADLRRDRTGWYRDGAWSDSDPEDFAPEVMAQPRGGTYAKPLEIALVSDNGLVDEIFYTFDDPAVEGARWQRYIAPITLTETATLATRGSRKGGRLGLVRLIRYEIGSPAATAQPTIAASRPSGTYAEPFEVSFSIDCPAELGWVAYYTVDDSEPTKASPVYARSAPARASGKTERSSRSNIKIAGRVTVKLLVADDTGRETRGSFCYCQAQGAPSSDFRDETIYFLITTRFFDGNPSSDFFCRDRIQFVAGQAVDPHWRGDFAGLIQQLDYIKELGFSSIWITPPVENRSGLDYHGYHAYDWTRIDPRLESPGATYADLIREAHARGLKIIQDVVINHSSQYGIRGKVWIDHLPIKYYVPRGAQPGQVDNGPYRGNLGSYAHPFREDNDNPIAPEWFRERQTQDPDGIMPLRDPKTGAIVPASGYDPNRFFGIDPNTLDKTWYHQEGFIMGGDWESARPLEQRHMAGDCIDLNTEGSAVKSYIMEAIDQYLDMGVDALRIDTTKHIERDNLLEYVNHWKARKPSLFVFGEALVKGTGWGDLFGDDNGPSEIRPWWYTRLGHDPRNPNSGGDSGFSVLDFSLFSTFRDNLSRGSFSGIGGILSRDYVYGDASKLVTFFQNHDVGPDNDFRYRFGGETWQAALAYNLLWTIRGIPCLYFGEEIAFQKGAPQDVVSNNDTLDSTGRAYFGDHLLPERISATKGHTLFRHIQRLNEIRQRIPALRTGVMKNVNEWGSGMCFIRDASERGSYAVVGLSAGSDQDFTVSGVENGSYTDAITGQTVSTSNGVLQFHVKRVSAGIYVKNGPGKIGEDLEFLR